MKINVNDTVRVKLTGAGRAAIAGIAFLKPDDDGWLDIQLWEAMYVFGPKMFHGNSELPFETNIELTPSASEVRGIVNNALEDWTIDDGTTQSFNSCVDEIVAALTEVKK